MCVFNQLIGKQDSLHFAPFVKYVCFPHFKNMEPGSRIDFTYPITAIVGPNGTNKSSILRALQGASAGNDVGKYWFETALDPIEMQEYGRQRYYYGYSLPSGSVAEVLQTRVNRVGRSEDYFETDDPRPNDGMKPMPEYEARAEYGQDDDGYYRGKTRWKKVQKKVLYLDFRQELPAYDIYTSFNWSGQKMSSVGASLLARKKEYIRSNSSRVKNALVNKETTHRLYNREKILEPAIELEEEEVRDISAILGREYEIIRIVKHAFFGVEGYTAQLVTNSQQYSEAYAGSGEFAAIILVHKVHSAAEQSLILLDEPETSLHPGAQRELVRFLAKSSLQHGHQIVMSTHAPGIIQELPDKAVKILDVRADSGRVAVLAQSATSLEAFSRLGTAFEPRTVLVEDKLAAEFVRRAAVLLGEDYANSVRIVPAGGANRILSVIIPVQAQLNSDCVVILDGDMQPDSPLRDSNEVPDDLLEAELELAKMSKKTIKMLQVSGGGDNNPRLAIQAKKNTLHWIYEHVDYLPCRGCNPEQLLLKLSRKSLDGNEARSLDGNEAKREWCRLASESMFSNDVSAEEVFFYQKQELGRVFTAEPLAPEIVEIQDILQRKLP